MLHRILGVLAVLSLWAAPAFAAEPIKIGAVVSVTGPASFLGEPEKNTLEMVKDELNAKGGVLGRPVELIVYDDESDVNKAVLATEKLLKKDGVMAVIGATTSGSTLAIMNKFPAAQVPLVSMSAAEKIVNPVNPWVFKVAPSDRHAVGRILQHAKAQGYKKIAIVTVSDGFGQAGREVLKELIPARGFTLVADEVYGPKDTDMTAQLTKLKDAAPDAIICWGTNPGPAVVARNRAQLGITTPLYMSHGVASKKFIELAKESAEGLMLPAGDLIVAAQLPDSHPQKAQLVEYTRQYQDKFKSDVSTFGGHGWDGLKLVAKAIEAAGTDKPAAVRDALEKIAAFPGIGGVFTFSATDHNGLGEDAFEMVVIQGGDWKIVK
ncbi:ABC transporter substrate-binding protein [Fundidesulfovibrio terrae]|uniref:ABC transporter substrate-binding protein n=1 Tax=Fundidesulfovibrio terrae TaxID=2922866 RepID=UPI001FAF207A|nr:ABC transporter substrate-binding protein [Fundidesulfovibrio terrae]